MTIKRREFLFGAAAAPVAAAPMPIIDTHIHLFDPTRPQGVPWPPKSNTVLYRPALPARYRAVSARFGITGAVAVECSPWLEDNQWLLDTASTDPIITGVVGNLEPGTPDFRKHLDRFRRHRLFRGIRNGNLWGRDPAAQLSRPDFIADLKALAAAGLSLDTANPTAPLMEYVLRLTDRVPELRIVIDHLAKLEPPGDPAARRALQATLRELARRPLVYVKGSAVLRRVNGVVPEDPAFYRPRLDELWDLFGEDRLLYGSDWPNSDNWGPYPLVFKVVHEYFQTKPPAAVEKFFWKNAMAAYKLEAARSA